MVDTNQKHFYTKNYMPQSLIPCTMSQTGQMELVKAVTLDVSSLCGVSFRTDVASS